MAYDSRDYEWADISLFVGGQEIQGIRAVKCTRKAEKEAVYGKGRTPLYIATGNYAFEGEFVMLKKDYDRLCDIGGGSILGLVADCLVNYGNPSQGDARRTNKVVGAQFTEETEEMKQGDKFQEVKIPYIALEELKNI